MFFRSQNWASKVTDRTGLSARSREATVLHRLILWSAKQTDEMLRVARGLALSKAEGELGAAIAMARNASAVAEVGRVLRIEPAKAHQLLWQCRDAAASLACEEGLLEVAAAAARDREAGL
jgi:hypothetical protein